MRTIREKRHVCAVLIMVLVLFATSVCSASAISKSVRYEVYQAHPINLTVKKGKTAPITKVMRYSFTIRGLHTFQSVESVLHGLDGSSFEPTSFKWISANKKIATVNSSGKVKGVKKGTTYIYPVPKGITKYKKSQRGIIYLDVNLLGGLKVKGGFAAKVKVTK